MFERMKRATEQESGFTLIELLVVIAILGILAGVVVFAVGGISDKGNTSACKIDTRTIRTAEEASVANGGDYTDGAGLKAGGFLSDVPTLHDVVKGGLGGNYTITITAAGTAKKCGATGNQPGQTATDY